MFGVGTAEVPSVMPARRSVAPSYFERTCVISLDYGGGGQGETKRVAGK